MRAWRLHEHGRPRDVLRLEGAPVPQPDAGDVRVAVQGFALNLNDLERVTGGQMMVRPELPCAPGMEVMGVVDATGPGAEAWIGRRVVGTTKGAHGGYAEYAVCPAAGVFPMPESVPSPDAAALFYPFHLAWLGLFDRADLAAGETVLVHAAAGGAGSAAVQLAVDAGARVLAVAGSVEKLALARDLGAEVTIDSSVDDLAAAALAATDDVGVDVVFDTVGEAVLEASLSALRYNGRYVMLGFASGKEVADEPFLVPRRLMLANCRVATVMFAYAAPDLRSTVKTAMGWNFPPTELGTRIQDEILERVAAGRVRAVVGRTLDLADDVPGALEDLARRATVGRTVVTVESTT
jgi:NADPH2:quinone reductase